MSRFRLSITSHCSLKQHVCKYDVRSKNITVIDKTLCRNIYYLISQCSTGNDLPILGYLLV